MRGRRQDTTDDNQSGRGYNSDLPPKVVARESDTNLSEDLSYLD